MAMVRFEDTLESAARGPMHLEPATSTCSAVHNDHLTLASLIPAGGIDYKEFIASMSHN